MKRLAFAFVFAAAAAGCAPKPAPVIPPAPPAVAPAPVPAPGAAAAAPDTTPSPEALAVLATIPEPLGPAASTPGPAANGARPAAAAAAAAGAAPKSVPAPPEAFDSLRVETQSGEVPVPAPTRPLSPAVVAPAIAPAVAPPVSPPPAAAPPDTCWRVQVGAPTDRDKGKALRDAAESLLMVPMIVDREAGRFKVRSRDCLSRSAAESLRDRATASGFKGVFLVRLPGAP